MGNKSSTSGEPTNSLTNQINKRRPKRTLDKILFDEKNQLFEKSLLEYVDIMDKIKKYIPEFKHATPELKTKYFNLQYTMEINDEKINIYGVFMRPNKQNNPIWLKMFICKYHDVYLYRHSSGYNIAMYNEGVIEKMVMISYEVDYSLGRFTPISQMFRVLLDFKNNRMTIHQATRDFDYVVPLFELSDQVMRAGDDEYSVSFQSQQAGLNKPRISKIRYFRFRYDNMHATINIQHDIDEFLKNCSHLNAEPSGNPKSSAEPNAPDTEPEGEPEGELN